MTTVVLREGQRVGTTDWWGFAESFRRGFPEVMRDRVVAARCRRRRRGGRTCGRLRLEPGSSTIFDLDEGSSQRPRRPDRPPGSEKGRAIARTDLGGAMAEADGLITCGHDRHGEASGLPLAAKFLRPRLWVAEIVYFPLETELLRTAKGIGCRTLDGGGMAVFQAAEAFRLFTGIAPNIERMLSHFVSMGTA